MVSCVRRSAGLWAASCLFIPPVYAVTSAAITLHPIVRCLLQTRCELGCGDTIKTSITNRSLLQTRCYRATWVAVPPVTKEVRRIAYFLASGGACRTRRSRLAPPLPLPLPLTFSHSPVLHVPHVLAFTLLRLTPPVPPLIAAEHPGLSHPRREPHRCSRFKRSTSPRTTPRTAHSNHQRWRRISRQTPLMRRRTASATAPLHARCSGCPKTHHLTHRPLSSGRSSGRTGTSRPSPTRIPGSR